MVTAMGLFFEKASKQSSAQRMIGSGFFFLITMSSINHFFLNWNWLEPVLTFLLVLFFVAFMIASFKNSQRKEKMGE